MLMSMFLGPAFSAPVQIFNGTAASYLDPGTELKPYTIYEYRVWADNSAGSAISLWSRVVTYSSYPIGVAAPVVKVTNTP